jgi:hypothetical protein
MRNFIPITSYYYGDEVKEDEMVEAYTVSGSNGKCIQNSFLRTRGEKTSLKVCVWEGGVISKCLLGVWWKVTDWIDLVEDKNQWQAYLNADGTFLIAETLSLLCH